MNRPDKPAAVPPMPTLREHEGLLSCCGEFEVRALHALAVEQAQEIERLKACYAQVVLREQKLHLPTIEDRDARIAELEAQLARAMAERDEAVRLLRSLNLTSQLRHVAWLGVRDALLARIDSKEGGTR